MPTAPSLAPTTSTERRSEPRLRYSWQMYFQHPQDGRMEQGRTLDLSRSGAAFTAPSDGRLWPGKELFLRMTHPMVSGESFSVLEVRRAVQVLRVDPYNGDCNRVAVRLTTPLDYDPASDAADGSDVAGVI